jgi:hypothetical protein
MSSQTVDPADVADLMFETLCQEYSQDPTKKYYSYVSTQSLRKIMSYLDPDQVISMRAEAYSKDKEESFKTKPFPGAAGKFISVKEDIVQNVYLRYEASEHGSFPWADVKAGLDSPNLVDDIAIKNLVVRVDSPELQRHSRDVMEEALGLNDRQYLQSPFFFEMSSRSVNTETERRLVKDNNDEHFLNAKGHRVLENQSVFSFRAQTDKGDQPLGVSPRELEELAFNFSAHDTQSYGVLYSMLFINKWMSAFSRTIGETTLASWTEEGTWER